MNDTHKHIKLCLYVLLTFHISWIDPQDHVFEFDLKYGQHRGVLNQIFPRTLAFFLLYDEIKQKNLEDISICIDICRSNPNIIIVIWKNWSKQPKYNRADVFDQCKIYWVINSWMWWNHNRNRRNILYICNNWLSVTIALEGMCMCIYVCIYNL